MLLSITIDTTHPDAQGDARTAIKLLHDMFPFHSGGGISLNGARAGIRRIGKKSNSSSARPGCRYVKAYFIISIKVNLQTQFILN